MGLDLKKLLTLKGAATVVADVLSFISVVVMGSTPSKAKQVVEVVKFALETLLKYQSGTITADKVKAELALLRKAVSSTDDAAMEKLRKKFAKK